MSTKGSQKGKRKIAALTEGGLLDNVNKAAVAS